MTTEIATVRSEIEAQSNALDGLIGAIEAAPDAGEVERIWKQVKVAEHIVKLNKELHALRTKLIRTEFACLRRMVELGSPPRGWYSRCRDWDIDHLERMLLEFPEAMTLATLIVRWLKKRRDDAKTDRLQHEWERASDAASEIRESLGQVTILHDRFTLGDVVDRVRTEIPFPEGAIPMFTRAAYDEVRNAKTDIDEIGVLPAYIYYTSGPHSYYIKLEEAEPKHVKQAISERKYQAEVILKMARRLEKYATYRWGIE